MFISQKYGLKESSNISGTPVSDPDHKIFTSYLQTFLFVLTVKTKKDPLYTHSFIKHKRMLVYLITIVI